MLQVFVIVVVVVVDVVVLVEVVVDRGLTGLTGLMRFVSGSLWSAVFVVVVVVVVVVGVVVAVVVVVAGAVVVGATVVVVVSSTALISFMSHESVTRDPLPSVNTCQRNSLMRLLAVSMSWTICVNSGITTPLVMISRGLVPTPQILQLLIVIAIESDKSAPKSTRTLTVSPITTLSSSVTLSK